MHNACKSGTQHVEPLVDSSQATASCKLLTPSVELIVAVPWSHAGLQLPSSLWKLAREPVMPDCSPPLRAQTLRDSAMLMQTLH